MKRKPGRKPTKRKRTSKVQGIPVGNGLIQKTIFPFTPRPDAEVRAEEEKRILYGHLEAVQDDLERRAHDILEYSQQRDMDHSTKPHRFSWGPGFKHFYTVEKSILRELVEEIAAAAFHAAADRYRPEIAALVARLERQTLLLEQRRENGQILAEEGRAARKVKTDRQADRICKLYRRIRDRHPPGRRGNGAALEAVSRQFGSLPGKDKPITVQAIRKILKRCGESCR